MSLIFVPRPLQRLSTKPLAMLTFLMERARLGNVRYVIGGATALQLHGLIQRKTEDVDFYIPSRMTLDFARMLIPHLDRFRQENLIFPRLRDRWTDLQAVERATKMSVFYHYDLEIPENVKADISESPGLLEGDGRFIVNLEDGLQVASIPVLMVFKLCAMCRGSRNGQQDRLDKDVSDLVACLDYLSRKNPQSIPLEVQEILQGPDEEFSWETLRDILGSRVPDYGPYIQAALVELGFPRIDVYGS